MIIKASHLVPVLLNQLAFARYHVWAKQKSNFNPFDRLLFFGQNSAQTAPKKCQGTSSSGQIFANLTTNVKTLNQP